MSPDNQPGISGAGKARWVGMDHNSYRIIFRLANEQLQRRHHSWCCEALPVDISLRSGMTQFGNVRRYFMSSMIGHLPAAVATDNQSLTDWP